MISISLDDEKFSCSGRPWNRNCAHSNQQLPLHHSQLQRNFRQPSSTADSVVSSRDAETISDNALVWNRHRKSSSRLSSSLEAQPPLEDDRYAVAQSDTVTVPLPVAENLLKSRLNSRNLRNLSKQIKVVDTWTQNYKEQPNRRDQKKESRKDERVKDDEEDSQYVIEVKWPEAPPCEDLKFPPPQLSLLTLGTHTARQFESMCLQMCAVCVCVF
jgi:hypothetical protein